MGPRTRGHPKFRPGACARGGRAAPGVGRAGPRGRARAVRPGQSPGRLGQGAAHPGCRLPSSQSCQRRAASLVNKRSSGKGRGREEPARVSCGFFLRGRWAKRGGRSGKDSQAALPPPSRLPCARLPRPVLTSRACLGGPAGAAGP